MVDLFETMNVGVPYRRFATNLFYRNHLWMAWLLKMIEGTDLYGRINDSSSIYLTINGSKPDTSAPRNASVLCNKNRITLREKMCRLLLARLLGRTLVCLLA